MRKIVVSEFMSADGVIEAPDTWQFPFQTDEMGAITERQTRDTDAFLLGRVTYEVFAGFWPTMTNNEFGVADKWNSAPKYVVSTTLDKVEWNNSRLIKGNVAEEVSRLKQQPGQDILVGGSAKLVQTLMQHDLVDDYRLLVYPVVLGSGKRLFANGHKMPLKLVDARPVGSGVVALTYQKEQTA